MTDFFTEIGRESYEFCSNTEIKGFENCELISNEQLAGYLNEVIPNAHLTACPSIEFTPKDPIFVENPNCCGYFNTTTHEIHIDENGLAREGVNGLLDTIIHEVGHNAHSWLETFHPTIADKWNAIHKASYTEYAHTGIGFVSNYATTNVNEDFAETYYAYVRDPELLQTLSPQKYKFMHDWVFNGIQYAHSVAITPVAMANFNNNINPFLLSAGQEYTVGGIQDNIVSSHIHNDSQSPYRCFDMIAAG